MIKMHGRPIQREWLNETAVCLATGPSLNLEDCEFVRGKARVIAINDAHRLAPWADVLYSSDRLWWIHHKGVPDFGGRRIGIGSQEGKNNGFQQLPDVHVMTNAGPLGLELDPRGLRHANTSGYAAINLAVHFGASRIVLLGYDCHTRNGVHFFGKHEGMRNPDEGVMAQWRKRYASMVEPLKAIGVEVINCTPGSSLAVFPLANLREVFASQEVAA